jgi:hypothetical protein
MAKTIAAPREELNLDDVREAMQQAIADQLTTADSKTGNKYYTLPNRQVEMRVGGVIGTFSCSWFNLRDAAAVGARQAATARETVAALGADERRKLAEELLASL